MSGFNMYFCTIYINIICAYCAFSNLYLKGVDRNSQKMTFDTAKTILDYLWDIWEEDGIVQNPLRLNIGFYGGEPLMNFPVIRFIVENAKKIIPEKEIQFSLVSNLSLMTDEIAGFGLYSHMKW